VSAITAFSKKSNELSEAKRWGGLYGAPYHGGGGGIGSIKGMKFAATIYHQYSDGATNYHDSPEGLNVAIATIIKADFRAILDRAIALMETEKTLAAVAAKNEHKALMEAAGITD
jgi:hypothetical protein